MLFGRQLAIVSFDRHFVPPRSNFFVNANELQHFSKPQQLLL
jgi:hypothetical protein